MSFGSWAAGRSTLRHLHQTVQQNITRTHRLNNVSRRQESTKANGTSGTTAGPARNASTLAGGAARKRLSEYFAGRSWAWAEPLKKPFRAYTAMQQRRPLLTQWNTTVVIYFLGDVSAQTVQSGGFTTADYEPVRALRAMLIGAILSIPSYKWFLWLGRNFNYPSHLLSLGVKILISQCLFTPIFASYFFGMQSLLSGGTLAQAWERICTTVPVSWANSWKLWPAVTALNFTFVAPRNRSVFAGCIAIFWQTYLSWLNRKAELAEGGSVEAEKSLEVVKATM